MASSSRSKARRSIPRQPERIGSIGSGGAELRDIAGDVVVGSVGSGGVDVRNVGGALTVRSVGSGDVDHEGVKGQIDIPKRR